MTPLRERTPPPNLLDTFHVLGIELRPEGREFAGLAVWRGDRNPSLRVSPDKGRWFDMARLGVRGEGSGDAFDAIKLHLGCDFKEAKRWAVERGLIASASPVPTLRRTVSASPSPPKPVPPLVFPSERTVEILTAFANAATFPDDCPGARYLAGRGIPPDLARRHGVRFIRDPKAAARWCLDRWPLDDLRAAGLLNRGGYLNFSVKHEATDAWIPFPILFPFWQSGRVLAIQWRRIEGPSGKEFRKEHSVGATPIPWNADALADAPAGTRVFLTEGMIDALSLLFALEHAWEHPPEWAGEAWEPDPSRVVGIPGAGRFHPHWARMFAGLRPVIVFDPDKAGHGGAESVGRAFLDEGLPAPPRVVLPPEKDLNALLMSAEGVAS